MKFFAEPNLLVNRRLKINGKFKLVPLIKFDDKGEFETNDIKLIKKLKLNFKFEDNAIESDTILKCKKCDFQTNNKGELLAHYRKEHPKEG